MASEQLRPSAQMRLENVAELAGVDASVSRVLSGDGRLSIRPQTRQRIPAPMGFTLGSPAGAPGQSRNRTLMLSR
jgi:hypothetical protein